VALVVTATLSAGSGMLVPESTARKGDAPVTAVDAAPPGPFVTILFSRTQVSAADYPASTPEGTACVRDNRGVATLETTVAPFLAAKSLVATGSLQTGTTLQSRPTCVHEGQTTAASWDAAGRLSSTRGWTFVSHSATRPESFLDLTPDQITAETCGSAAVIASHGLPGASGLYVWPNNNWVDSVQEAYVSRCIAFGRQYSWLPTTQTFALTPPYYQRTKGINGGSCNDPTLPCYSITAHGNGGHYNLPSAIIARIRALKPGEWYTMQFYLLVTATSPSYAANPTRWDCSSADPTRHWTNDNERYCWNDFQTIVRAIPATTTVTDPLSVAHAFGRPGY